jgi:hypothetical protein
MGLDFGFYPESVDVHAGGIAISTLPELARKVDEVRSSSNMHDDWIYPGPQEARMWPSGDVMTLPYSARVFGLPKTHRIEHATSTDPDHLVFLMHCFGFFKGMRMTETPAGFLDSTPVKIGAMTDFTLSRRGLECALVAADEFWVRNAHQARVPRTLIGVIHSLFLAQRRHLLAFEKFIYAYTAIDGAYAVGREAYGVTAGAHRERIAALCSAPGIPVPRWATRDMYINIVGVRNDAIHEGLFLEAPLGFRTYAGFNGSEGADVPDVDKRVAAFLPTAMNNFICRLVVGLLGLRATDYLTSNVNSRCRHGIDL